MQREGRSREALLAEGLAQVTACADRCRATAAHLVIFDRRPGVPPSQKLFREARTHDGRVIDIWGM